MKNILTISLFLVGAGFGFADQAKKSAPGSPDCKKCDVPSRAAVVAGAKKEGGECAGACSASSVTYVVTGMTCGGCEGKVADKLAKIEGVEVEKICSKSGHAVVKYDAKKVKPEVLIATINATGYKVTGEQASFKVKGMTCGGCTSKVSDVLAKTEGVTKVEKVCSKGGCAVVVFDPAKTDKEKVAAANNTTPYTVVTGEEAKPATEKKG